MKFGLNAFEKILLDETLEQIALLRNEKVYMEVDHLAERIRATLWEKDLKLTKERTLILMLISILDAKRFPTAHTIDLYRKVLKEEHYKIEVMKPAFDVPEQTGFDTKPGAEPASSSVDWS